MIACVKRWKRGLVLLCLSVCCLSCVKQIDNPQDTKDILVVNAILNPDSLMQVHLSRTAGMSNAVEVLSTLQPTIIDMQGDTLLLNYLTNGWYQAESYPQIGHSYKVAVDYKGQQYEATTTVPSMPNLLSAEIYYTGVHTYDDYYISNISVKIADTPGEDNYYDLQLYDIGSFVPYGYEDIYQMNDPIIQNEGLWQYEPKHLIFSDEMFRDDTASLSINVKRFVDCDNYFPKQVQLRHISCDYYMYAKSWTKHYYNQQGDDLDSFWVSIFKGAPVSMYSNVESAYGVVISYAAQAQAIKCVSPK